MIRYGARMYVHVWVASKFWHTYVLKPNEMYIPYILPLPLASSAEPCPGRFGFGLLPVGQGRMMANESIQCRLQPKNTKPVSGRSGHFGENTQSVLLLRQHQSNKQQIPLFATGSSIHTPLSEIYVKEIASVTLLISVCSKECLRRGPRATLRCYHKSRKTEQ